MFNHFNLPQTAISCLSLIPKCAQAEYFHELMEQIVSCLLQLVDLLPFHEEDYQPMADKTKKSLLVVQREQTGLKWTAQFQVTSFV